MKKSIKLTNLIEGDLPLPNNPEDLKAACKAILKGMRDAGYKEIVDDAAVDTWSQDDMEYLFVNYADSYLKKTPVGEVGKGLSHPNDPQHFFAVGVKGHVAKAKAALKNAGIEHEHVHDNSAGYHTFHFKSERQMKAGRAAVNKVIDIAKEKAFWKNLG